MENVDIEAIEKDTVKQQVIFEQKEEVKPEWPAEQEKRPAAVKTIAINSDIDLSSIMSDGKDPGIVKI